MWSRLAAYSCASKGSGSKMQPKGAIRNGCHRSSYKVLLVFPICCLPQSPQESHSTLLTTHHIFSSSHPSILTYPSNLPTPIPPPPHLPPQKPRELISSATLPFKRNTPMVETTRYTARAEQEPPRESESRLQTAPYALSCDRQQFDGERHLVRIFRGFGRKCANAWCVFIDRHFHMSRSVYFN